MHQASLLLQPHTGRRAIRAHEGTVVAAASNQRWFSDGFEIPCWNGEVVRVAFAIDTHDREVMAWVGTSGGGISGKMIRDMMLDCVERRFEALRASQPVQWLADNGSAYNSKAFAKAIAVHGLKHQRTRPYTPKTNGKAERFIQTSIRESAYVSPFPSSADRTRATHPWLHACNTITLHLALKVKPPVSPISKDNVVSNDS